MSEPVDRRDFVKTGVAAGAAMAFTAASYDRVYVEQLKNLGGRGDLLIAISGSGNSPNILRAVEWANAHGLRTFGLTGMMGES